MIYFIADSDPNVTPDTQFNAIFKSIDTVLQGSPPGEAQNLAAQNGGRPLITNCWIEGDVLFLGGIEDAKCSMIVPIRVKTGI